MKSLTYQLISGLFLMMAVMFTACEEDTPETSEQEVITALNGNWQAVLISDGSTYNRLNSDYANGFAIAFNVAEGTYSTVGGPDKLPIPNTGKFTFGEDKSHLIILNPDESPINVSYIVSDDKKTLTIAFQYKGDGFENGRTKVVEGYWTIEFEKGA